MSRWMWSKRASGLAKVPIGLFTLLTCTSPLTNIFVDTRPNVTLGNKSLSCTDAWMSDGMKMDEDVVSIGRRHIWVWSAS